MQKKFKVKVFSDTTLYSYLIRLINLERKYASNGKSETLKDKVFMNQKMVQKWSIQARLKSD